MINNPNNMINSKSHDIEKNVQYDSKFYSSIREGSSNSAKEIVPLLIKLVNPKSIVDIGCGDGTWLSFFKEYGIDDILGIDGEHVDPDHLCIPRNCFLSHDLVQPLKISRRFDMVMSLEVGEHLPPSSAKEYVSNLTKLGSVVVFSAAIPRQGGVHHVNEQWPEYWANFFREEGFLIVDCIRKRVWDCPDVQWWYAQNMIVYVEEGSISRYPKLQKEVWEGSLSKLSIVHPRKYLSLNIDDFLDEVSFLHMVSLLPKLFIRALKNRISTL